jgi:7,8-dihydropterin-6-yl-methyl-4-(beta-D-ribofuranosyl)aminobenzene 5'-phosphate synthase
VAKTVEAFKQIDPDYLIPMHCTGFNTMMAIQREMPAKLIMPSTGTQVVFGAGIHLARDTLLPQLLAARA